MVQNKVLPGSYMNFISVAKASATLSERGIATMPLELDWGVDGGVFEVTNGDFQKNSMKIFGYDYTHEKLKGLRDLFLNVKTLYAYRLNSGVSAENTYAKAVCSGTRGNDLKVVIQTNVDDTTAFDVTLWLGSQVVDKQTVHEGSALVDNDYVTWKAAATLTVTAGVALSGGTNGTVAASAHQTYLDRIEAYTYNIMGVVTEESAIKQLYANFTKRMRDEVGAKFQTVLYQQEADYEGVINVKNICKEEAAGLIYWVSGLEAGCDVNKSCLNRKYDGAFQVDCDYTQAQLTKAINDGEFTLHMVNGDVRVLSDINSMVTTSDTKGDVFKDNQSMRVMDQIANDIALLFNTKYLGVVPNDAGGRTSLWADIVKHHEQLEGIRAIENFNDKDVTVAQGDTKKSVVVTDVVSVVNAMAQLYMTVKVA